MLTEKTHDLSERSGPLRIGVLSDTHGEISATVLEHLKGSDVILHAGDVCGQPVLDKLATITADVIAVGGNNDPYFEYDSDRLPELVHVRVPGGTITVVHGHQFGMHTPSHDAMRDAFSASRAIVYGHSHRQVHDADTAPVMLNPGAAGSTRTNGGASCATIVTDPAKAWEISLFRSHV